MPETKRLLLVVAVALIDGDGRVLLAERPQNKTLAGLWEFPGGKLQKDETPEAALIRELQEELDITVESECLAPFAFASHSYDDFHVLMPLYVCRKWQGDAIGKEGQTIRWVTPQALTQYDLTPAGKPLAPMLRDLL